MGSWSLRPVVEEDKENAPGAGAGCGASGAWLGGLGGAEREPAFGEEGPSELAVAGGGGAHRDGAHEAAPAPQAADEDTAATGALLGDEPPHAPSARRVLLLFFHLPPAVSFVFSKHPAADRNTPRCRPLTYPARVFRRRRRGKRRAAGAPCLGRGQGAPRQDARRRLYTREQRRGQGGQGGQGGPGASRAAHLSRLHAARTMLAAWGERLRASLPR